MLGLSLAWPSSVLRAVHFLSSPPPPPIGAVIIITYMMDYLSSGEAPTSERRAEANGRRGERQDVRADHGGRGGRGGGAAAMIGWVMARGQHFSPISKRLIASLGSGVSKGHCPLL